MCGWMLFLWELSSDPPQTSQIKTSARSGPNLTFPFHYLDCLAEDTEVISCLLYRSGGITGSQPREAQRPWRYWAECISTAQSLDVRFYAWCGSESRATTAAVIWVQLLSRCTFKGKPKLDKWSESSPNTHIKHRPTAADSFGPESNQFSKTIFKTWTKK